MKIDEKQQTLLRRLPGVDRVLEIAKTDSFFEDIPQSVVVNSIRITIENLRDRILNNDPSLPESHLADSGILEEVKRCVAKAMAPNLRRVVNATGVVVHTNLGRSLLATEADEMLSLIAGRYSNLEYNLTAGQRGSRYSSVEDIICEVSGAQAAIVVNNNAGAVLLCLETMAKNKTVIVSRGELVEIGGSFRIPDVMAKSGGILKEVGTTNRTHLRDYENAIDEQTGLLLKVHRSNYSVVGFTAELSLQQLLDFVDDISLPDDDPSLGTSEKFVSTKGNDIRPGRHGFLNRWFLHQAVFGKIDKRTAAKIFHYRNIVLGSKINQLLERQLGGEAHHAVVAPMYL